MTQESDGLSYRFNDSLNIERFVQLFLYTIHEIKNLHHYKGLGENLTL